MKTPDNERAIIGSSMRYAIWLPSESTNPVRYGQLN